MRCSRRPGERKPTSAARPLLALILLAAAGCATPPVAPEVQAAPPRIEDYRFPVDKAGDYTYEWSAADGIDLFSTEATLTRAAAEALALSQSIGTEASFPGYAESWTPTMNLHSIRWYWDVGRHAYNGVSDSRKYFLLGSLTRPRSAPEYKTFGAVRGHLIEFAPRAEGFSGRYCLDVIDEAHLAINGEIGRWNKSLALYEITFLSNPDTGEAITRPLPANTRESTNRAPNYNVFAGWSIDEIVSIDNHGLRDLCNEWQRTQHPDILVQDPTRSIPPQPGSRHVPPPPGTTYPGWPRAPQP